MDCNGAFWFTYFARALCLGKLGQTLDILGEHEELMRSTVTIELVLCLSQRETIERLGRLSKATVPTPAKRTAARAARDRPALFMK
jgi:hypothetical protein